MLKGKIHFLQQSAVLDLSEPPYTMQDKLQSIGILTPPGNIALDNARTLKVELYPEDSMGERIAALIDKKYDTLGKVNKLCYCINSMDYRSEMKFGGELERKADMFTKRTIGAKVDITHVDTASEALAVSIGEKARVDMEYMSQLTGMTEQELLRNTNIASENGSSLKVFSTTTARIILCK